MVDDLQDMVSWLVSKETLVSEALRVLSCTGVGTLLPPGLAWSGGGKEGAMVQDPRPLEVRDCHDDDDVTMHKKSCDSSLGNK